MSDDVLRPLLGRLAVEAGLVVAPHTHNAGEWYAGLGVAGDIGPYESAEAAVVGGVAWLVGLLHERTAELNQLAKRSLAGRCTVCGSSMAHPLFSSTSGLLGWLCATCDAQVAR